jgi:hypothetical protein
MLYLFSVYLIFCQQMFNWSFGHYITLTTLLGNRQSPTLGAHTHARGFWAGMGAMLLFMGGHGWASVLCILASNFKIGVKLPRCREYANQEALRAEANDSERPFICQIQPRLGVSRWYTLHNFEYMGAIWIAWVGMGEHRSLVMVIMVWVGTNSKENVGL